MTSKCSYTFSSPEKSFLFKQKIANGENGKQASKEIKEERAYMQELKKKNFKINRNKKTDFKLNFMELKNGGNTRLEKER